MKVFLLVHIKTNNLWQWSQKEIGYLIAKDWLLFFAFEKNIWKKLYFILFRYLVAGIMHKTDMKSCNGIVQ